MIRVELPQHLQTLACVGREVEVWVDAPVTPGAVVDGVQARYPVLQGTIRDHVSKKRRPFLRFFACQDDLSLEGPDLLLPEPVVRGVEPLMIVGAIAGG